MTIQLYDLTKPKEGGYPSRFYFGLLPYINVTWSEIDVMVFIGLFHLAIVFKFDKT